jgi:Uma2 family endonuclease
MTALKHPAFVSIEDYLDGENMAAVKHEYLGGAVHAMAGGTRDHAAISANAIGSLFGQLRGKPCRPFTSDLKVRIELPDHTRFYYPDVQVVCQPDSGDPRYQDRPVVIIEVLSESTRRTDLGEKKDAYLAIPTLKALLLAESDRPYVLVYRRRAEGGFAAEAFSGIDTIIPLPEIGADLSLSDLYDGVDFTVTPGASDTPAANGR